MTTGDHIEMYSVFVLLVAVVIGQAFKIRRLERKADILFTCLERNSSWLQTFDKLINERLAALLRMLEQGNEDLRQEIEQHKRENTH